MVQFENRNLSGVKLNSIYCQLSRNDYQTEEVHETLIIPHDQFDPR